MKLQHILTLLICLSCTFATAQRTVAQKKDEVLDKPVYEELIKKEFINNIYIPENLNDAFEELKRLSDKKGINKFKEAEEAVVAKKLHFGLGRWIMKKWNLHDGSRYAHYLREKGISYPDDMARFTIISLHRHLNGIDIDATARIKAIKDKRDKEYKDRMLEKKVIKEITKENQNEK